jgi:hypothetical protein
VLEEEARQELAEEGPDDDIRFRWTDGNCRHRRRLGLHGHGTAAVPTGTGRDGRDRDGTGLVDHACSSPHVVIADTVAISTGNRQGALMAGNRRNRMQVILRAAMAVFGLGIGSVYGGDGDGQSATTLFTARQEGRGAATRTVETQPPTVAAQNGGAAVTRSQRQGAWPFRVFALP